MNKQKIDYDTICSIALALPSTTQSPHFDKTSFRVNNKIFATLRSDKDECVLKLSIADQTALLGSNPDVFYEVGWAHQGWIGVSFTQLPITTLSELFESAWCNVAPKKLSKQFTESKDSN